MTASMGTLYEEHALLAASFVPSIDEEHMMVSSYGAEADANQALFEDVMLCDLTGAAYQLVSGPTASSLVEAAFAGRRLGLGECAFEPLFGGDGALMSVPALMRTGDAEYAFLDFGNRGSVAQAWLGFLSTLEQDGYRPYEGSVLEDATDMLVPLLVAGKRAREVLLDYVGAPSDLPVAGCVKNVKLDQIGCLIATLPQVKAGIDAYVVLIPHERARILWRSFLSFDYVSPIGHDAMRRSLSGLLPWGRALVENDKMSVTKSEVEGWNIVRGDGGFVGQRALEEV